MSRCSEAMATLILATSVASFAFSPAATANSPAAAARSFAFLLRSSKNAMFHISFRLFAL